MTLPKITDLTDIEHIESVSWTERFSCRTTTGLIRKAVTQYPQQTAIAYLDHPDAELQKTSYTQFWRDLCGFANALHAFGITPSDTVSYVLPNLPHTHTVLWGTQSIARVAAINPFLEPDVITELLEAQGARILVVSVGVQSMPSLQTMLAAADAVPETEAVIVTVRPGVEAGLPSHTPGRKPVLSLEALIAEHGSDDFAFDHRPVGTDIAAVFHTGGTTGRPKLAPHSHENEAFVAQLLASMVGTGPDDAHLVGLPLFHVNAIVSSGLTVLGSGGTVLLATPMGYRTPGLLAKTWSLIEKHRVLGMAGVPTIYAALLGVPVDGADLTSLKFAGCGAAPLSADMFRRFEAHSGVQLLEGYGLTEGTVTSSLNPLDGSRKVGSIGLRLPYQEMKIVTLGDDGDIDRELPDGAIGTIVVRGPNVFQGYLGLAGRDQGLTSDGWLDTGDLGWRDEDGYFWLTGRTKDIIIRGGHNIDAGMIESALASHPDILNVAAVGQPDTYSGELPCAYLELADGSETTEKELYDWARDKIGERAAVPVYIETVEALPKTAVGKIFKPELRRRAKHRVLLAALAEAGVAASLNIESSDQGQDIVKVTTDQAEKAIAVLSEFTIPYAFT